jgi:hypothetical protein
MKAITLYYSLEEMKSYLEKNGYTIQEIEISVYISGQFEESLHKCLKVYLGGEDTMPWSRSAGAYDVEWVFSKLLRERLLLV